MRFVPTELEGAFLLELQPHRDERGFFARTWCAEELAERGLEPRLAQCSLSFNPRRHTLRGMHYQVAPWEEAKVVRCTAGAIHDVIVDLRPESASFRRHLGVVLDAASRRALYVPPGCAHGFLTLEPDTEVHYQISRPHRPEASRGVRWNDPVFGIEWPAEPAVISERDRDWPDFEA